MAQVSIPSPKSVSVTDWVRGSGLGDPVARARERTARSVAPRGQGWRSHGQQLVQAPAIGGGLLRRRCMARRHQRGLGATSAQLSQGRLEGPQADYKPIIGQMPLGAEDAQRGPTRPSQLPLAWASGGRPLGAPKIGELKQLSCSNRPCACRQR